MGSGMRIVTLGLTTAAALAISACTSSPAAPSHGLAAAKPTLSLVDRQARVPDEYLVTLAPEVDENVIPERYGHFGIRELNALGGETYLLVLTNDPGPQEMADLISDDARFKAVQPNIIHWANRSVRSAE